MRFEIMAIGPLIFEQRLEEALASMDYLRYISPDLL